jgi:ferrochelatase
MCLVNIHFQAGVTGYKRAESLNDSPLFIEALADIVRKHLHDTPSVSKQWMLRCPGCKNDTCSQTRSFFKRQSTK